MSPKNLSVTSKTHKYLLNCLRDQRVLQTYKKFERNFKCNNNFIVAVSGGADSLALTFLTKIYSIKKSLKVKYFIIDHKLRKNSSSEAQSVKNLLRAKSINVDIIKWKGIKPKSNVQSLAREKRYNLLVDQAKKLNIKNILTGHHWEDLYENFFIRISRGSGLNGLVSFGEITNKDKIKIIRPLLNFEKRDLIYLTKNVFKKYVNDPSNKDNKFKRVRIRNLTKNLQTEGFDKKKFFLTIKNLKDSNETINFYVKQNLKDNSFFNEKKNTAFLKIEFFNQPHEVIFRSFSEIIKSVGRNYYPSRGKKIERIIEIIKNYPNSTVKRTLGNCLINKVNQSIIVTKELKI
jgi:tRNA(Ile)-lysidine synthase